MNIIVRNPFMLTDEEFEKIALMAAANFRPAQIAIALGVDDSKAFIEACLTKGNECYNHYHRGILELQADVDMKMAENAKKGNITAVQILDKHAEERKVENLFSKYFS